MAGLQRKGDNWYLCYQQNGERKKKALGKMTEEQARKIAKNFHPIKPRDGEPITKKDLNNIFQRTKSRAVRLGIGHDLTMADLLEIVKRSEGKCEVTGIKFSKFRPHGCVKRPWHISIDRIDSRGPYSAKNCRVVCVAANFAMGEWGYEVLKELAEAVAFNPIKKVKKERLLMTENLQSKREIVSRIERGLEDKKFVAQLFA